MLMASTGRSGQPDIWATALAVHFGLLEGDAAMQISTLFAHAYKAGSLSYKGNIPFP
jgi:hypothetical protein